MIQSVDTLPISIFSSSSPDWPSELMPVFRNFITTEYATLTKHHEPITYPVTPYMGDDETTLDVSTV